MVSISVIRRSVGVLLISSFTVYAIWNVRFIKRKPVYHAVYNSVILNTTGTITNKTGTRHGHLRRIDVTKLPAPLAGQLLMQNSTRAIEKLIEEIFVSDKGRELDIIPEVMEKPNCGEHPAKYHGVEDLLCMEPPVFSPRYKNPCWFEQNGNFRCLPYFQLIGMDKSGSTDLFDKIAQHPSVLLNKGVLNKETMWWSWLRYGHWLQSSQPIHTFQQYLNFFSKAAVEIKNSTERRLVTADATPMDIWDMSGWVDIPQNAGLEEPKYLTPHLIKHVNPDVKLLVILRDPVERLFSDYAFLGLGRMNTIAFHEAVVASIKILHNCTRLKSLRACLYDRQLHLQVSARIHLGFYSTFFEDWFQVFNRKQFFIMRTEEFSPDMAGYLTKVFQFLDLEGLSKPDLDAIVKSKRKYVTQRKSRFGKMLPETRAILNALYSIPNRQLASILQDDGYLWTSS